MKAKTWIGWALWVAAVAAVVWGALRLETERADVPERVLDTPEGSVRLYGDDGGPLVIVAHGFAGSAQLMQTISRDLAKAGFTAVAFDFIGHGRNRDLLSPDVTRIEGTTTQLVDQTVSIVQAVRDQLRHDDRIAFVGHSMATDIVIRAAERVPDVVAIVAISMYSDAVTPEAPARLLVISGAWEARLRAVALDAVRQVTPDATEAETVRAGDVVRRAVAAPNTEHLGVLYSTETLAEVRAWLGDALLHVPKGEPRSSAVHIVAVLVGVTVLATLVARVLPVQVQPLQPQPWSRFVVLALVPALPAAGSVLLMGGSLLGVAAIGSLALFLGAWGIAGLALHYWFGRHWYRINLSGVLVVVLFGLGVFALALDRYGAAFLPIGQRTLLMAALLLGTVPFMLADRLLVFGATFWQRGFAHAVPIAVLLGMMVALPEELGLLFTVLPVLALFFIVYGTMGHAVAARVGPVSAGLGLGICLAWAIAASTPLFAG